MTDRAEIERLLNQTGRTLEVIPKRHSVEEWDKWVRTPGISLEQLCHQSDVIELLVGALRDALDKPMQKPLTLGELKALCETGSHCIYIEHYHANPDIENPITPNVGIKSGREYWITHCNGYRYEFMWTDYEKTWRAWASRPTDEEREAAAWES